MTKEEHIKFWIESAEKNWPSVQKLFNARQYVDALFWGHLVIEKLLKACWIKDNPSEHPPRTHALLYLLNQTKLQPTEIQKFQIKILEDFQLESRYPDYSFKLYQSLNRKIAKERLNEIIEIRLWLLNNLP
jgi:HEPN domain-containing protein